MDPQTLQKLLKKRAEELSKPIVVERNDLELIELLVFKLAEEEFAIETKHIKEVYPLTLFTPLPGAPPFVMGLVNLRRKIVVVEDVLAAWTEGKLQPSASLFDSLHATVDTIRKALSSNPNISEIQPLIVRLEAFAKESNANPGKTLEAVAPQIEQMMQRETPEAKPEVGRDKTIRVLVSKLDRVFQETEEMLMIKLASQQQFNQIKNLLTDLRDKERELIRIHRKCDTIEQARQALSQERQTIKTCIEAVAALSKDSQRNAHMVGSLVDTLLEDIKTVLMQPISTLFDSFPRMVRDIARDLRKEVQFESQGREIEVDRRILTVCACEECDGRHYYGMGECDPYS